MSATIARAAQDEWPELPLEAWQDTYATLHMWSQIVGKVRLAFSPRINHWWEVPLYVSATGLTTSAIPYPGGIFEVEFDFIHHQLLIKTNHDTAAKLELKPRSVADFYQEYMAALASLGIAVKIWKMPVEIANPIAFDEDTQHASYVFGGFWLAARRFLWNSARASSAKPARCIFSGAASIWRRRDFRGGGHRSVLGRMRSRAKRIRTK
jgi:hypothetical protein